MVQISPAKIQLFSLSSRVSHHPGYDVLKASIHGRGLDNPPVLPHRPGDEKYMLASGVNIRKTPDKVLRDQITRVVLGESTIRNYWRIGSSSYMAMII